MDSFNEFRNKGKKIRIQPKPASWRKLEQRLDARKHTSRRLFSRSLGMVAGLGLLLVSSILLITRIQKEEPEALAENTWEVIQPSDATAPPSKLVRQNSRVPEGQPFKQLISKTPSRSTSLDWLAGNWQPTSGRTQLIESWESDKNGAWSHKVSAEGQVAHEDMTLQKNETGQLELLVRLEQDGEMVTYPLEQQTTAQLLFANENLSFPKRIAFRRLGPDHLSIVLYNPEPMGLSEKQVRYLQQYNSFQPQLVRRDLERLSEM